MRFTLSLHAIAVLIFTSSFVGAASPPSETIFPSGTKGWVSVPNVDTLRDNFSKTQLGELMKHPGMTKFMEDLQEQLKEKVNDTGVRLGVSLEDLEDVYSGEVAIGLVQPNLKDNQSHALAMTVDATGKQKNVGELLAKIEKNLAAKGAVKKIEKIGTETLTQFTLPLRKGQKVADHAAYLLHGDTLLAADQADVVRAMLDRLAKADGNETLKKVPGFENVMRHVAEESSPIAPHVRWYVEPLGFAETNRAANGGRKKKGVDPLAVLKKHGFAELQGLGGFITFATERHETLYRTYLYAPGVVVAKEGKKQTAAQGMMDFPNTKSFTVQPWVPPSVSTYVTWNWKMAKAFEHFGPLFDGFTEEGTFDEILAGMADDPAGPEINIRKELIAILGERVTVISDYQLPINAHSERLLVGFELKPNNEKAALAAIRKLMKAEPNARKLEVEGQEVWEIAERIEEAELPTIDVEGSGGFLAGDTNSALLVAHVPAAAPPGPPAIVVAVAHDHIFVGTHAAFLGDVLKARPAVGQLGASKDYMLVDKELAKLGDGNESLRFFTRTDDAYRPTYELIQQGKLPTAETLLARALNRMIGSEKKGEARKAVIDGKNMPNFEDIRKFFGPGGMHMQTRADGWFVAGCLLHTSDEAVAKKP